LDVQSATDSASATLGITTAAQVMRFGGGSGNQNAYKETGAAALGAFSLEVMAVGDPNNKGSADGTTGQVLFNLSAPGNANVLSLWRPAALSIAFGGGDHATQPPLDLTTGQHRLTLTWDKTSGTLTLYDNGKAYQHWDNISKGTDLPANTIVTVGQKMNDPAGKGGFNSGEQFHGDLFSVTLANQKVGPADVNVPLANHLASNQLLLDLRESGGRISDGASIGSAHAMVANNVGTASQQVSTTASTPPIGALLNLNLKVTPPADPDDHISRELLRGLPPGTVISDGSGGHSLTVPASGAVDVLTDLPGWQHLDQLSAQLPSGYKENLPLELVVETTGPDGSISRATSDTSVLFDPTAQTPSLPPLPSASVASQPLAILDQQADDPDQPASSVNVMDQSLEAPALHLDPMALQNAVRSVGLSQEAPLDSMHSGDASNSVGGNSLPSVDQQSADLSPDLLAHAVQELSTSPSGSSASNGDGSGNGQDLGGHSVPVSTDPDPFAATNSAPMDADADNTATPLPPVEPPQDQNLDHLATL
jgi:hypothetical protein